VSSANTAAGGDLKLINLTKSFGEFKAVDDLSVTVPQGSFFALLGPSGCGKTTTLRMIAGLEEPTSGSIYIGDSDITFTKPYERPVNTVFQNYALFPHLTIFENIAFGLRRRGIKDVKAAVVGSRKPSQLSGGQRQRIALARAIVVEPKVLLLDEPLGALDLKLREQMQIELKQLQRHLGITFVFVTHDQEEALTLSDRIAVFNNGNIEQLGTPQELYEKPKSEFVANFVGTTNILSQEQSLKLFGKKGKYSLRPENIEILSKGKGLSARVIDVSYLGSFIRLIVEAEGVQLKVTVTDGEFHRDQTVQIKMNATDLVAL